MITFDKEKAYNLTAEELTEIGQYLLNLQYGEAPKVDSTQLAISSSGVGTFFMDFEEGGMTALKAYSIAQINYLIEKGIIKQV